jgi:Glycosyl hydrolase catalytic core
VSASTPDNPLVRRTRLAVAAALALLLAAVVALSAAQSGEARHVKAKPGAKVFGLVLQGYEQGIDAQALREANPDTVRILVTQGLIDSGNGACTSAGGACNWSDIDAQVGGAAQAGSEPRPFLYGRSNKPPIKGAAATDWKEFIQAAVQRYKPGGAYWNGPYQAQYPGGAVHPVKAWQVWNEPGSPTYYANPNVAQYAKLLKTARATIKGVDSHAKIVLAGLFSSADKGAIRGRIPAVQFLQKLYQVKGAKGLFDIVALHPYAREVNDLINQVEQIREVMQKNGDGRKPLAITELGWSSNNSNGSLLAKGVKGQATTLKAAFRKLLAGRTRYHLDTVNWFSLRDAPKSASSCPNCPYAGLNNVDGSHKPAWNAFTSFT